MRVCGTSGLFGGLRVPFAAFADAEFFNMLMIPARSLGVVAFVCFRAFGVVFLPLVALAFSAVFFGLAILRLLFQLYAGFIFKRYN
jgi:hypothetical protein